MIYKTFGDFVNKKKRDATKHLELVERIMRKHGIKVESFLEGDSDDPYVFCFNPSKNTSFDGIRVYSIAGKIAFRIQKESKTHPYGRAYPLNIEEMFEDFLTDEGVNEQQAGQKVIEAITNEVRRFFQKSSEAEHDERRQELENQSDGDGEVSVRSSASDYSTQVFSKGN